jgi:transposase InsO family protein
LLIDTGASSSLLKPKIILKKNYIIKTKPYIIRALNKETVINEKIETTLFKDFGDDSPPVTYYLHDFHEYFDGIIGHDILSNHGIQIDFNKNILIRKEKEIKLFYKPVIGQYEYYIKSNKINEIKIPVDVENGPIFLEEQSIADTVLIGGLYESFNWETKVLIESKQDTVIKINQPIKASPVNVKEINNIEINENENVNNLNYNEDILNEIRMDHLNDEERKMLKNLIIRYKEIFLTDGEDLSFTNQEKHKIRTTDEIAIYSKTYRYPYAHKEEVQNQIQKMLDQNIIRPSYSPWSSPIWIVPKKDDASGQKKWRLVVDYRKLNDKTIDDRYPIPNITEILDKLGKSMYFTTIDLASGFHQIEMHPDDIKKTAFTVENGHYEYTRMPFGLKNAPATFQRVMDSVLKHLQNKICLVYMDDIIVFSTSLVEHIQNLEQVFNALRQANLKIQLDKTEFLHREVAFLGHIVTENGIKPNPTKIEAVKNYPIPKTQKEIKQFLGLLGYYRKFIKDFAKLTKPLTTKLKKDGKIDINEESYKKCFEICKNMLVNDPILIYPDFTKPFILTTDASNFALGAVLSQNQNGREHPICYASRTLNVHECNYSTIEKELLAIVWATKYFRPYLFGRKFKIQTDHRPLNWLMSLKEPNSKLVRWRLKLEEFNYEIEYKPGKINNNADALSRIPIEINVNEDNDSTGATIHSADEDSQDLIPISESCLNKFKFQYIIQLIRSGAASIKIEKIFKNTRKIIKLKNFDEDTLVNLIKNHFNPTQVNAIFVENLDLYVKIQETYKKHFSRNKQMRILKCVSIKQDITDELQQDKIIKEYHEQNNHRGINESFEHLKRTYFFPNLKNKIQLYNNQCEICQIEKYERRPPRIKFQLTETPKQPLEICHIDIFFIQKNKPILTIIDKFSRYAQAYLLETRNTPHIKEKLMKYFSIFGKPKLIVSDQERAVTTIEIKEYLANNNINVHFTSINSSNSNSPVERFHSTLLEHLRLIMNHDDLTLKESIYKALNCYNNSINQITKYTPFELFFGRKQDEDLEIDINKIKEKKIELQSNAYNNSLQNKQKYINKLNENREEPNENLPTDRELYTRSRVVNKLQPRNKKINIQRQKKFNIYDKNDLKHHKAKINKPRKLRLQNSNQSSNRNPRHDRQPRNISDTDE